MDETDTRYATVTDEPDGGARLEFRRTWPDDADDVWAALTADERTARWIGSYDGERREGATGTFTMTAEEGAPAERLGIVECAPARRLVLDWPDTGDWRIEVDLVAQRGGCTLILRQRLADRAAVPDVATGWHWYLDRLDAEIGGRAQPADWDGFRAEVAARYGSTPG